MLLEHLPQEILRHIFREYLLSTMPSFMVKVSSESGVIYEPVDHGPYRGVEVGDNWLTVEDIKPTMTYEEGVDHDCEDYSDLLESGALNGAGTCEKLLVVEDKLVIATDPVWLPHEKGDCPHAPFIFIGERLNPVKRLKGGVALNHGMRVDATVKVEWKIKSSETLKLYQGWSDFGTELAINAIAYERF
jgi:hypothetical protein